MTEVSLLIRHHAGPTGDVLLCKGANGWEFPCGCVKTNETEEQAAARIACETLGIEVRVGKRVLIGHKDPKDGYAEHFPVGNFTHSTNTTANYHCYYDAVNVWQTEPVAGKYTEFKWVHASELGTVEFAGDDKNFMAKYDAWVNASFIPDVRML